MLIHNWTPHNLGSSLTLWLDAADASTIVQSGGTVSQWNDKSGYGRNATAVGSNPGYSASGFNNRPCLTFNGSNQKLATPASSANSIIGNGQNATVFAAITGIPYQGYLYGVNLGVSADRFSAHVVWTDGVLYFDAGNFSTSRMYISATVSSPNIICLSRQGAAGQIIQNGTQLASSSTLSGSISLTTQQFGVGGNMAYSGETSYFHSGTIAEFIVVTGTISAATIAQVKGYLAWKWGLVSSLASGHQFKNTPPTNF